MVESVTAGRSLAALEVLEAFSDTIVVLDGAWRFTYLNRAALQVAGLPADDLLGRTLWEAYPQLLGTPIEEAYRRAAADGKPQHLEAPGVISGRWYDIHAYPSRAGLVIYGRDVTGRVEAEQALRESERRHRALAEASPVGLFQTDGVGRCVYVNERWCRITGLTPAEAAGDGWERALHPDDRDRVFAEWRAATAGGPGSFSSEYRFRRPDGAVTWVFGQGAVERDAAGAPVRFAGTVTDITDRKHAELALAAMNEELERRVADRTASLLTRTRELEAAEALLRDAADHNARLTRELEHRVGNHLAGLLGLVAAMRQRGSEPGELARVMEGRLLAMAHVNRMLAADGWRPRSWRSLVQPLMEALGGAAAFRPPPA